MIMLSWLCQTCKNYLIVMASLSKTEVMFAYKKKIAKKFSYIYCTKSNCLKKSLSSSPSDWVFLSCKFWVLACEFLNWVTCKMIFFETAVSLGLWSGVIYHHSQDKLAGLWSKGRRGGCQKNQSNLFPVLMCSTRALTITDVVFPNNLYSCFMYFQLFFSRAAL